MKHLLLNICFLESILPTAHMVVKESLGTQLAMLTVCPVETKDSTLLTTKLIIPYHHAAVLSMSHITSTFIKESRQQSQYNDWAMGWTMTETQFNSWQ
jgi:hypothetical protein